MNRRRFLGLTAGAALPTVSGCLDATGSEGGMLEVLAADEPPDATTTDATDDRIRDVGPVQRGLRRAHEGDGVAEVEVSEGEFDEVARTLSALPWYERTEHDGSHVSGIYLRYEDAVYVVVLTPFCTDSWFRDAQSDRGEYGWGGCFDREAWADSTG